MEHRIQFLTENDCWKSGRTITPKGVMVHSCGVAQPNVEVFLRTWNRPGYTACVHAFVHEGGVVQTLPWNRRGWHAGGAANNTHIGFEICEPAGHTYKGGTMIGYDIEKQEDYFRKVYANAVELTAELCKSYSLNPLEDGVVICHSEGCECGIASNHADVMHWFPKHEKTMDDFRHDVAKAMAPDQPKPEYKVYSRLEDTPRWCRPSLQKAVDQGVLKGTGNGRLDVSEDLCKVLTLLDRLGLLEDGAKTPKEEKV